jgi:hypothetical protein
MKSVVNIKKLTLLTILSLPIGIYPGSLSSAQAQGDDIQSGKTCRVTDPTGTPLNARLRPNGKVVNRIKNGRNVYVHMFNRSLEMTRANLGS